MTHRPGYKSLRALTNPRPSSRRPPLDKLLQVLHRRDAQHEPPLLVRDDGEVALPTLHAVALKERLELLQGRLHRNDAVLAALALEADHGLGQGILGRHLAGVEEGLQVRDGEVTDEGAVGVDDGQVGVVTLEGGEEREGDGVVRGQGEGSGRVEVFYRRLFIMWSATSSVERVTSYEGIWGGRHGGGGGNYGGKGTGTYAAVTGGPF